MKPHHRFLSLLFCFLPLHFISKLFIITIIICAIWFYLQLTMIIMVKSSPLQERNEMTPYEVIKNILNQVDSIRMIGRLSNSFVQLTKNYFLFYHCLEQWQTRADVEQFDHCQETMATTSQQQRYHFRSTRSEHFFNIQQQQ